MTTPNIIKETSDGTMCIPIRDELFNGHREIYCTGEINAESANSMIVQLHFLALESSSEEITLYINSPGGEVDSGLAVYDTMQTIPCPVRTVCVGTAASIAAVLFAAGTKGKREILPHAHITIHDPLVSGDITGSALYVNGIAKDLMSTRDTVGKILAQHTGRSLKEVFEKTAADYRFDATDALAWGLADRFITRL